MQSESFQLQINYRKPNKFNLVIIYVVCLALATLGLVSGQMPRLSFILLALGAIIASVIYFIPIMPQFIKSILLPIIPMALVTVITISEKELSYFFIYGLSVLAMSALYYNIKIMIVNTILINIFCVVAIITLQSGILYVDAPISLGIDNIIRMNLVAFIMFLGAKWGYSYVYDAKLAEHNVAQTMARLDDLMTSTKSTIEIMHNNLVEADLNLGNLELSSGYITEAIDSVADGVSHQYHSEMDISEKASESMALVSLSKALFNKIDAQSTTLSTSVATSSKKITHMNTEINNISKTIESAHASAILLQTNISHIDSFLADISNIAKQTNLLALNASIEAARAGEEGKGFAVVANEVRKLAEQTAGTARNIVQILSKITDSTSITLSQVREGTESVSEGVQIMIEMGQSFDHMKGDFNTLAEHIKEESKNINIIASNFSKIIEQIDSITTHSEQNAAATEEIRATITEQSSHIKDINSNVRIIRETSEGLNEDL